VHILAATAQPAGDGGFAAGPIAIGIHVCDQRYTLSREQYVDELSEWCNSMCRNLCRIH
jgi:hypothetical protein